MVEEKDKPIVESTTSTGNEPELPREVAGDSMIDRAEKAATKMEEQNNRFEELLQRQEKAKAEDMLSGRTEAGTPQDKPKPITDEEYAAKLARGEVDPLKEDGFN